MKKKQNENNITTYQWFKHEKKIYEKYPKVDPPAPLVITNTNLFTVQEIEVGIKKLGVGKAKDLVEIQVEYLKWGSKILAPHIMKISTTSFSRDSLHIGQQYRFSRVGMSTIPPTIGP
jgi:hypothetical protein